MGLWFRSWLVALCSTGLVLVLTGCGLTIPADPDGTLDRVRGGTLRVGVSPNEPWTQLDAGQPSGIEVELVREFAATLGAQVEWSVGGEEALIADLEQAELDLVIGGLTSKTPWSKQAGITRAFTEVLDEQGEPEKHVMAVPMGENAFLVELEKFLSSRELP